MANLINLLKKTTGNTLKTSRKKIIINQNKNTENTKRNRLKIYIWQKLAETNLRAKTIKEACNQTNFHIVSNLL
jgi:uncharacterized protein (UPF0248 family)